MAKNTKNEARLMKTEKINDFAEWCLKKAKKSKGTTRMYSNYLTNTPDFNLDGEYETIFSILKQRITHPSTKCAHIAYLKYLKDNTNKYAKKQLANMLIMDLKDLTVIAKKSALKDIDELRAKVYTKDELAAIYNYMEQKTAKNRLMSLHNLLYARISYESAGRPEEIRRYEWSMINYNKKEINVPRTITKRNKSRIAEFSEKTKKYLIEYEKLVNSKYKNKKPKYVFFGFKNYNQVWRFIRKISKKAIGREMAPYCFKHSFMTHTTVDAIKSGEEEAVIKEKLKNYARHVDTKTTEMYILLAKDFKRMRIMEKYGEVP